MDNKFKNKKDAQDVADSYNMGADYSFASVKQDGEYWVVVIKYYS